MSVQRCADIFIDMCMAVLGIDLLEVAFIGYNGLKEVCCLYS